MGARATRPTSRFRARALILGFLAFVTLLYFSSALEAATPPTVSDVEVTLTASSIDVSALTFVDKIDLTTDGGTVSTLEFSVDDATIHGLALSLPCFAVSGLGGVTAGITTGATDTTTAPAGITFYATDLQATVSGSPVHFNVADLTLPPAGTVLLPSGTLDSPTIVFILAQAPSLTANGSVTSATFCTPSGGAAPAPARATTQPTETSAPAPPKTSQTPTETGTPPPPPPIPTPTESPTPTTTPSPEPAPSPTATDPSPTPTDPAPSPTPTDSPTPDPSPSPSV